MSGGNDDKLVDLRNHFRSLVEEKKYNRLKVFRPYFKQREFARMGATKKERMLNAGNQLGKSDWGAYETTLHLTGLYPDWWDGLRFDHPITAWACGMSAGATRDILQAKLCGQPLVEGTLGTGFIPRNCFSQAPSAGRGIAGSYDTIVVTWHDKTGKPAGTSTLTFKSYEQGWKKFQGTTIDWVWMDEEPDDLQIFAECQTRTTATGGSLIVTFTPLSGETELFLTFSQAADPKSDKYDPGKGFINMTGDDVLAERPNHLAIVEQVKARAAGEVLDLGQAMIRARESYEAKVRSWPAYQRQARRNGTPVMGAGVVFEFTREEISVPRFHEIPGHFRSGWGVDFGGMGASSGNFSHPFGAVLCHHDPLTDTIYVAHALRLERSMPIHHADAMKAVCAAAPVFWPHDGHRTSGDDKTKDTRDLYKDQGLRMWSNHATFKNGGYATEAGLLDMQQRFASGRLKVFDDLAPWWEEFINYHRDERGEIVKVKDDLMSATRIATMMVPRYGIMVPMGSLNGRHWRDGTTTPNRRVAEGVDDDHWGI